MWQPLNAIHSVDLQEVGDLTESLSALHQSAMSKMWSGDTRSDINSHVSYDPAARSEGGVFQVRMQKFHRQEIRCLHATEIYFEEAR